MVISHEQRRSPSTHTAGLIQARRRVADVMLGDRTGHNTSKLATWKSVLVVLWIAVVASTLVLYWPAWHVSLN